MSKLDDPCLSGGNGRGRHAELLPTAQAMVLESDGFVGRPQLDFEGWRAFLRSSCGNHPDVIDPSAFIGWVRPISVCGLDAAELKIECGSRPWISVAMPIDPSGRSGMLVSPARTITMRYFRSLAGQR